VDQFAVMKFDHPDARSAQFCDNRAAMEEIHDRLRLAAKRPSLDSSCRCSSIVRIREFTACGPCVTLSYDMEWGSIRNGYADNST
jgi:hypothetical protein